MARASQRSGGEDALRAFDALEIREVTVPGGTVRYREVGEGPTLVFVHGLLVNGALWRHVVALLSDRYRCVVPDLPLGSHDAPMDPDADLTPPGLARLVDSFLAAAELDDVTLVGNDTGGAICQLVAAHHPGRVARMVLTPCDAYENFLPLILRYLQWTAPLPGSSWVVAQSLRIPGMHRLPVAFGWLSKRPLSPAVRERYFRPSQTDAGVRRDLRKVLRGIDARHTLEAARRLGSFDRPVLLAWATEDRVFPLRYAERLAGALPDARLERIEDSYTFVPEDRPEALADAIAAFAGRPVAA